MASRQGPHANEVCISALFGNRCPASALRRGDATGTRSGSPCQEAGTTPHILQFFKDDRVNWPGVRLNAFPNPALKISAGQTMQESPEASRCRCRFRCWLLPLIGQQGGQFPPLLALCVETAAEVVNHAVLVGQPFT